MDHAGPGLVFALATGVGILAQVVARHLGVPSILPLLAAGVLCGPDGLGWIDPGVLGDALLDIVGLAVAIILFEGGLCLDLARLRREDRSIRTLVTLGAVITAAGGAAAAYWIMGWSLQQSILFGTLVIVTGPTVIRPLLRNVPLKPRLATILEAEGVLIDPVGAIVAAVALQVVLGPSLDSFASGVLGLVLRLGFGAGFGLAVGLLLGWLLRARRVVPEGLENIAALSTALVLYALCEAVLSESGILAVTVAGVAVGNVETRVSRALQDFQEQLTVLLIGVLFILLAADVRLDDVYRLGLPGLLTVGALMFLVRPLNVVASTVGSGLAVREKAFLSWVAPRGIVAAAIASLFAVYMKAEGFEGGTELRALVFLTIAVTVLLQGSTAPLLARWLGVRQPGREGYVILGAEGLALSLGDALREGGGSVTYVDVNPVHIRAAAEAGFPTVFGNGLELRTLSRARPERCTAVIGCTSNDNVNSLFAREAREEFDVPETYVARARHGASVSDDILSKQDSRVLFDGAKDVERWNVRFRHGYAVIETLRYLPPPDDPGDEEAAPKPSSSVDPFVIFALRRGERWLPMYSDLEPRPDELVRVAIHTGERDAARTALRALGWLPLPAELDPPATAPEAAEGEEQPA